MTEIFARFMKKLQIFDAKPLRSISPVFATSASGLSNAAVYEPAELKSILGGSDGRRRRSRRLLRQIQKPNNANSAVHAMTKAVTVVANGRLSAIINSMGPPTKSGATCRALGLTRRVISDG
jgi:hypothetical protein